MDARWIKIMSCILIIIFAAGCATTGDVVRAKAQGKGTSKIYPLNAEKAWEFAKVALRFDEPKSIEEHRSERFMVARIGESTISSGVVLAVWIEPVDNDNTNVTVVIKRRDPTEISIGYTEEDFHHNFMMAWRLKYKKPGYNP